MLFCWKRLVEVGEVRKVKKVGWKVGRLEGWKVGRLEGWKVGKMPSPK
jgi:hypothetical protein